MSKLSLVKHTYTISESSYFNCYIAIVTDENGFEQYWFRGHDCGTFLEYANVRDAIIKLVEPELKQTWSQLKTTNEMNSSEIPAYWKPHSIFISEVGLYSLIFNSNMKAAKQFRSWVFEEVMPSLRREGQYKMVAINNELNNEICMLNNKNNKLNNEICELNNKNNALNNEICELNNENNKLNNSLVTVTNENTLLTNRINIMARDIIDKPKSPELLYTVVVTQINENTFAFTRCQKRFLPLLLKRLQKHSKNPYYQEICRKPYTPNGMHILHCVKDKLKKRGIPYIAKHNTIKILENRDTLISFIPRSNEIE